MKRSQSGGSGSGSDGGHGRRTGRWREVVSERELVAVAALLELQERFVAFENPEEIVAKSEGWGRKKRRSVLGPKPAPEAAPPKPQRNSGGAEESPMIKPAVNSPSTPLNFFLTGSDSEGVANYHKQEEFVLKNDSKKRISYSRNTTEYPQVLKPNPEQQEQHHQQQFTLFAFPPYQQFIVADQNGGGLGQANQRDTRGTIPDLNVPAEETLRLVAHTQPFDPYRLLENYNQRVRAAADARQRRRMKMKERGMMKQSRSCR